MSEMLFDIPESKSPKLKWMERHHLTTANYTDENNHLRIAVYHGMARIANGDTADEKSLNIPLWNEVRP